MKQAAVGFVGAGNMGGAMVERLHLDQAEALLARHAEATNRRAAAAVMLRLRTAASPLP